jgi:hypothetical protein
MNIYQPMLFVGLGGTGCLIGAELERRLRDELCGPDGTALQSRMTGRNFLPYQLPSCLQFVYADLNEAELTRLRQRVVPTEEHVPAAERTARFVRNLVPRHNNYPEVARSLRTNLPVQVREWLPPAAGEPRVAPLIRGAGQLPTVGRAALYETLRHDITPAQLPIDEAIGAINKSAGELDTLGGRLNRLNESCDVFVAFSVAGGTGAGIFYDYLHIIGRAFERADITAQIYPLVLMPSAFEDGMGGGRRAVLNSGRALLDLFRLVDDQNAQAAGTTLDNSGISGQMRVHYPTIGPVRLRPATVQTAFLFSRSFGVEREDLHRSIVSFVLSMVGTGLHADGEHAKVQDRVYQSFADDFVNHGVDRQVLAYSGIGNRGVSTGLVASMTVPVDDLADIISSRILARAVDELSVPAPGGAESNRTLIDRFLAAANLDPLRIRPREEFTEPAIARGEAAITRALNSRVRAMRSALEAHESALALRAAELARNFDHHRAVEHLLGDVDPVRLHRIVVGHPKLPDAADRAGVLGVLEERRTEPAAAAGIEMTPPRPGRIPNRWFGLRRARWSDGPVRRALSRQDAWYAWRSDRAWHRAWAQQSQVWERKLPAMRREITATVEALTAHARQEEASFAHRTADLYRPRTGVSYLLPPLGGLDQFYQAVVRRFVQRADLALRPTSTEAEILTALLGGEGWRAAHATATRHGPEAVVTYVRNLVKQQVKRLFVNQGEYGWGEEPLLPALRHLLATLAGVPAPPVGEDDLEAFRRSLIGMVPGGFVPQGTGQLKVLVAYPAVERNPQIEKYLQEKINLTAEPDAVVEFREVDTESIVVVFFRTSMSLTEVPELREVLRQWKEALAEGHPQDFLRWRQRLGYEFGWLATTDEHRVQIMHRLLCAMWNGDVETTGQWESPQEVTVRLGAARDAVSMTLRLLPYKRTSSWGYLIRAYEEWTLTDNDPIRRDFCEKLMVTLPDGVRDGRHSSPSALYLWFMDEHRQQQVAALERLLQDSSDSSRGWVEELHRFWKYTVADAENLEFEGMPNVQSESLRHLRAEAEEGYEFRAEAIGSGSGILEIDSGGTAALDSGYGDSTAGGR